MASIFPQLRMLLHLPYDFIVHQICHIIIISFVECAFNVCREIENFRFRFHCQID